MPLPKSVTKIDKHGVKYISSVDRAQYTIAELTRAALRDVAKILRYRAKQKAPKKSGDYKKNIATWVRKDKYTGEIWLQLGVYDAKTSRKKNKKPVFYAHIIEFGSRFVKGQGVIRDTTFESVDDIKRITGQYLSAIEDENRALGLIEEKDEVKDD